jgi:3-oxoacyl-[acyl-carrier protein] reductase
MDLQLKGKRVLITGSSTGIGEGTATVFIREGATVVLGGRDKARLLAVERNLKEMGGNVFSAPGDLATDAGASAVIDATLAQVGSIDILVNNAGGVEQSGSGWFSASIADWASVYEKNTVSAVRLVHAFVPAMKERRWGRVVNIGSSGAVQAEPHAAHYCAAKAATANMTLSLSKELAGTGVTANVVSPGPIVTPKFEEFLTGFGKAQGWTGTGWRDFESKYMKSRSIRTSRLGRPEDIGNAVAFVASPLADYITGTCIRVDGGQVTSINI